MGGGTFQRKNEEGLEFKRKKDESKVIAKLWENMTGIMLLSLAHVKKFEDYTMGRNE